MKKISLLFMAMFMIVLASCSGGVDINKCKEIAQKDPSSITVKDLEFIVDQYENFFNEGLKASNVNSWFEKHQKEANDLNAYFMTASQKYEDTGKEVPARINDRLEKVMTAAFEKAAEGFGEID